MSSQKARPRLSKGILEMKFMQRTKAKVDKEIEEAEGREMYSQEITQKMLNSNSNFIMEPSFVHCENLLDGRWSFRGMNPEIERLLELEQQEKAASVRHEQPKEVSDKEMAAFYNAQQVTMQKKFQTKAQFKDKRRSGDNTSWQSKKMKFQKPRVDDDDDDENSE
ncbi:M-phase phosphoprotein 6 [Rhagoletis pomonella]|uniref:M-phase phosphoprotein 6 n=1 Tax=Rhagoletis pomonella TaxID=28610 RepID=UPI0017838487|nr:M-phase phosphoprotein 6 [Rhagoletis pomonella]